MVSPTQVLHDAVKWRLLTMLPIEVSLGKGRAYRLLYRKIQYHHGGGTVFELRALPEGRPVWSQEFSARDGWLRGWTDGVNVPAGSAAAEVFGELERRHLAERVLPGAEAPGVTG